MFIKLTRHALSQLVTRILIFYGIRNLVTALTPVCHCHHNPDQSTSQTPYLFHPVQYYLPYMSTDPIRPGISGTLPVLWVLKRSVPLSHKIRFGTSNVPGFFSIHKNMALLNNVCKHADFYTVGENICTSRTDIKQPQTGSNTTGRGICVDQ